MRYLSLVPILLCALIGGARAQQNVTNFPAPWGPIGNTVSLSASNSSGNVQLGWVGAPLTPPAPPTAKICNTGANAAYVLMGDASVVVTTSTGTLVAAGICVPLAINNNQYLAGITASSTTTLSIQAGSGTIVAGTPGAGGGGTCASLAGDVTGTCAATVVSSLPAALAGSLPAESSNTNAVAGKLGEVVTATANGQTIAATFTNATPTVVTMTGNTFAARCAKSAGSANACALPIYFTGLGGSVGVSNATPYFVDPASISGSTFQIATTATNALTGTDVATSGTDSGTGIAGGIFVGTGTDIGLIGINLTAGDWDCTSGASFLGVALTAPTRFLEQVNTSIGSPSGVNAFDLQATFAVGALTNNFFTTIVRQLLATQTPIYLNTNEVWTGGATNPTVTGFLRCRREQ